MEKFEGKMAEDRREAGRQGEREPSGRSGCKYKFIHFYVFKGCESRVKEIDNAKNVAKYNQLQITCTF